MGVYKNAKINTCQIWESIKTLNFVPANNSGLKVYIRTEQPKMHTLISYNYYSRSERTVYWLGNQVVRILILITSFSGP